MISSPNYNAPFVLTTDASGHAIRGVLKQKYSDDNFTNIGYFSRNLNKHETKYSTFDRELLAIHNSIKYFSHILDGSSLSIETDHKPLCYISIK